MKDPESQGAKYANATRIIRSHKLTKRGGALGPVSETLLPLKPMPSMAKTMKQHRRTITKGNDNEMKIEQNLPLQVKIFREILESVKY